MSETAAITESKAPRIEATTKPEIQLNIGQALSTGTIGGKAFEAIPGGDVSVYTTDSFEQKTADQAAPASAADIDIDVRKDSKGAAAHGVKIELSPEGVPVITLEKGKTLSVEPTLSNETAEPAAADGVALAVNENRVRVTLPGNKVFEITPDGNATTYSNSVQRKTADATPLNAEEYQRVTIRNNFNAVAMNNSSVELTGGTLAIATDGISEAKKPAAIEAPADAQEDKQPPEQKTAPVQQAQAAPKKTPWYKRKKKAAAETQEPYKVEFKDTNIVSPITNQPIRVATRDLPGQQTVAEGKKVAQAQGGDVAVAQELTELTRQLGYARKNPTLEGISELKGTYSTSDRAPASGPHLGSPIVFNAKHGTTSQGTEETKVKTRLVQRPVIKQQSLKITETPKAEIELNIGPELNTGTIGGTAFDAIPGGDVSLYTTKPFEQKTADEAAPASPDDLQINVRKDATGVVASGVKIELNADGVPVVYTKEGKKVYIESANANDPAAAAETATAPADGVTIKINKNLTRVTLLGGKTFDITSGGYVTSYNSRIQKKTLTDEPSVNPEDYQQVAIRNGFNAVAMNGSSVERNPADKTLAVATDGISRRAKKSVTINPVVNL